MPYRGKVCQVSFNSTLPTYRNSDRFFDNKFGLPATEEFLSRGLQIINTLVKDDEKCRYILINMLCHYTVPPCYSDGTDIKYCREDCAAIFKECSAPWIKWLVPWRCMWLRKRLILYIQVYRTVPGTIRKDILKTNKERSVSRQAFSVSEHLLSNKKLLVWHQLLRVLHKEIYSNLAESRSLINSLRLFQRPLSCVTKNLYRFIAVIIHW